MRESASRGFFLGSKSPFGYRRVKVNDREKERPTLEVDPATAPIVREVFASSLRGNGLKEMRKELKDRGVTNRGKRWHKRESDTDPVRVEGGWHPLVSWELFYAVQQAMREGAPKVQRPGRVGSKFLLSGLLKCGICGSLYTGRGAKSGQFAYYICGALFRERAATCSNARYLITPRVE